MNDGRSMGKVARGEFTLQRGMSIGLGFEVTKVAEVRGDAMVYATEAQELVCRLVGADDGILLSMRQVESHERLVKFDVGDAVGGVIGYEHDSIMIHTEHIISGHWRKLSVWHVYDDGDHVYIVKPDSEDDEVFTVETRDHVELYIGTITEVKQYVEQCVGRVRSAVAAEPCATVLYGQFTGGQVDQDDTGMTAIRDDVSDDAACLGDRQWDLDWSAELSGDRTVMPSWTAKRANGDVVYKVKMYASPNDGGRYWKGIDVGRAETVFTEEVDLTEAQKHIAAHYSNT